MQKFISKLRGIGLLELMLSLAIIAILLVMATRYFSSASRSQKSEDTIQLIGEFESAINSYTSATGGSKKEATTKILADEGYISKSRFTDCSSTVTTCASLKKIWGTDITYDPTTSTLKFSDIPGTECAGLAAKFGADTGTCDAKTTDVTGNFTYTFR